MKKTISKKLFFILFIFYFFYNLIRITRKSVLRFQLDNNAFDWIEFLLDDIVIETGISVLLILFIMYLTKNMIKRKFNHYFIFGVHLLFFLVSIILLFFTYALYSYFIGTKVNRNFSYYFLEIVSYSNIHFLMYFVNVFIIYMYYYIEELKAAEIQKLRLKDQLSQVKVNILKYQLHPHFLFNTLNSISSLIETDKELAQNTLADFSDLLRDILYLKDTNFLTLYKEIGILKRYIDIMKIRFADYLIVNLNIEKNLENVLILSLIIQPILENSFKYGYSYDKTDLKIDITIKKHYKNLEIIIKNNGSPLPKKMKYGNGLKNTIERLRTLYEENFEFSISNISGGKGVVTKLIFPLTFETSTKQ